MIAPLTSAALLLGYAVVCSALEVGPVRVVNNRTYISYTADPKPDTNILECPYTLADSEVVAKVSWSLWQDDQEEGTFEWQPESTSEATGKLRDAVNLTRDDGSLELTTLRYDLAGYYSCAVTLSGAEREESEKWQLLIIDTTSAHFSSKTNSNKEECVYISSFETYAVFPPPTVHAGMYSNSHGGYYDEVTGSQWKKTIYANKSTSYAYDDIKFKISEETPLDAEFRSSIGVTKEDGTYIPLASTTSLAGIITERGCPELNLERSQAVQFRKIDRTCRNELKPWHFTGQAEVKCKEGFLAEGDVDDLVFDCHSTNLTWTPEPEADYLATLKCAPDPNSDDDDDDNGGSLASLSSLTLLLLSPTLLYLLE